MLTRKPITFWLTALLATASLVAVACTSGVSQEAYDSKAEELQVAAGQLKAKEAELTQLQQQLASIAPSTVVQVGQLQPAPAGAAPSGWDTAESIRGGMKLLATYDSSGPDAWDVKAHPLVYVTSQGGADLSPLKKEKVFPGLQIIDAYTKEVVTTAGFDLGTEVQGMPHALGISPDGKWFYVPTGVGAEHGITSLNETARLLVVNARTLKLDKILVPINGNHHVASFMDWLGRPRILTGNNWGSTFILDPNDDQRVVKAITTQDLPGIPSPRGQGMGHPYLTVDPTGRFLYQALRPDGAYGETATAGIAKVNLETGAIAFIWGLGFQGNPIGMAHTADGKYTYVNDGHGSHVYKIDNTTNKVVGETSAGVAGPYGLALSWDETELYVVGKGEGSHNTGNVLGLIDTKIFRQKTAGFNMPINLGETARSVDHGIIHPDPAVNELWVSNMRGWTTIVLDTKTKTVKTTIPQVNGGDTHSGGFVRYNSDWTGELLTDMSGPKKAQYELRKEMAAKAVAAR